MRIEILRQRSAGSEAYWQVFEYDGPMDGTVASLLDELNYRDDLYDIEGKSAPRIEWECSCMQGMCGSCAMVINGKPSLACETFLRDLDRDRMTIRPLRKFPVICDLKVDRSIISDYLRSSNAFIGEYRQDDTGGAGGDQKTHDMQYTIAKCLKCGLCLEVCPNYIGGKKFYGALFAGDSYLIAMRSKSNQESIRKQYAEHFGAGCSKALSCTKVCPVDVPTLSSMARMNRGR